MERLELRQERDFSEKFNATFNFIKQNFKSFFLIMLVLVSPLGIVQSIIMAFFQSGLTEYAQNLPGDLGNLLTLYGILLPITGIVYAWMQTVVLSYIKLYLDGNNQISIGAVAGLALRKFPKILGAILLIGILSILGFVLCILPGIYLSISLIMVPFIVFFEGDPVFEAFSRSFKLIKNKWWSTFGLLLVVSFLIGIMAIVFAVPQYIVTFIAAFHGELPYDSSAYILTSAITGIGIGLLYPIVYLALAFQYFNLVERKESQGLKNLIDNAANQPKIDNVNQGEY